MSPLLAYAQACAGSYDPNAVPLIQDELKVVHVFVSEVAGVHVLTFEGTHDLEEWIVDVMCAEVPFADYGDLGPVHLGMMRDVLAVKPALTAYLASLGWPTYVLAGHSKGAGEALLCAAVMKSAGKPANATYAFEAPRIGTTKLAAYLKDQNVSQTCTQNAHGKDIVTQVPWGPDYVNIVSPTILTVSDALSIGDKHRIPAVITALSAA